MFYHSLNNFGALTKYFIYFLIAYVDDKELATAQANEVKKVKHTA